MTSCCRACRAVKSKPVAGTQWTLIEIDGRAVNRLSADDGRFTLTLGTDGRVSGRGDCNTFFAAYSLESSKIDVSRIAATRKLCPNQAGEDRYFRMLESAATAGIDGEYMILKDSTEAIVASFQIVKTIDR